MQKTANNTILLIAKTDYDPLLFPLSKVTKIHGLSNFTDKINKDYFALPLNFSNFAAIQAFRQ